MPSDPMNRILRFSLYLFFFSLSVLSLKGQSVFIKTFGFGRVNEAYGVIQTQDLGYAITGSTTGSWNEVPDMYLMKTDSTGSFLWSHLYGGNNIEQCKAFLKTNDQGFFLVGYTNSFAFNNDYDGYLVRTDSLGNVLWTKSIGTNNWDLIESVSKTNNNGFVIAGTSYGTSNGHPTGWIVKMDSSGNTIWQKLLESQSDIFLKKIIQSNDGNYVACGYYVDGANSRDQAYAVKLDASTGDTLWTYSYHGPNGTHFNSVDEFSSGTLGLGGYELTEADTNRDEFVFSLTASGIKKWEAAFFENGKTEGFNHVLIINDTIYNAGSTSTFGSGNQDYHFVRVDSIGLFVNAVNWGSNDDEICYNFSQTSDTGFVLIGTTRSFGPSFQSIYLVKTDKNLTTTNLVTIDIPETILDSDVEVFPNPFSNSISVRTPEKWKNSSEIIFNLFSLSGELVKSIRSKEKNFLISIPEYPSGMYFVQLISSDGNSQSFRMIKQE